MSATIRSGASAPSSRAQHLGDFALGDQRARDLLVVHRADLLERVRERVVADVVEQRGDADERALVATDRREVVVLLEQRRACGAPDGTCRARARSASGSRPDRRGRRARAAGRSAAAGTPACRSARSSSGSSRMLFQSGSRTISTAIGRMIVGVAARSRHHPGSESARTRKHRLSPSRRVPMPIRTFRHAEPDASAPPATPAAFSAPDPLRCGPAARDCCKRRRRPTCDNSPDSRTAHLSRATGARGRRSARRARADRRESREPRRADRAGDRRISRTCAGRSRRAQNVPLSRDHAERPGREPPQRARPDVDPEMVVGMSFALLMVIALPMSIAYARRVWRGKPQPAAPRWTRSPAAGAARARGRRHRHRGRADFGRPAFRDEGACRNVHTGDRASARPRPESVDGGHSGCAARSSRSARVRPSRSAWPSGRRFVQMNTPH